MIDEYTSLDGTQIASLIRTKAVSPLEVLESAIERIERDNPALNAVVYKMYDDARGAAANLDLSRPLAGVPFLVKDLGLQIKGHPTSGGSRLTRHYRPDFDSDIVAKYADAGLVTLGKTNVPEFGILGVTEPYLWGPCRNPWNTDLTCGGSSGGSAAAVAARMVPIASGDDGGGSIRIPASACGLFGFKPSRGVQPIGPNSNEGWLGLVSGHVVTRTVRDSALVLECTKGVTLGAPYGPTKPVANVMEASGRSLKGKKIAFCNESLLGESTSSECIAALQATLKTCASIGLDIVEDRPRFDKQELLFSYYIIVAASVAGNVARAERLMGTKASLANVEHATWFLKVTGEKMRASHLEHALFVARQATIEWQKFLQKYDFFCVSTLADTPSPIGLMNLSRVEKLLIHLADDLPAGVIVSNLKKIGARAIEKTPNTCIFNMSGHPAMSVPTYWTQTGIPIGTQFVGRMGEDDELFALAFALESHYRWSDRAPPNRAAGGERVR